MFIRQSCAVYCASLITGVAVLTTFSLSTRAAAGVVRVDAHWDAVAERHREERLREERRWEERQQDARRQQAIHDDDRRRSDRAQRAHTANERGQLD
ncbi:hypothetical protein OH764_32855 (plasmid) [Burkholderia sp. M6-3]